jgi:copper oxidase (laccase) domain-containing protein
LCLESHPGFGVSPCNVLKYQRKREDNKELANAIEGKSMKISKSKYSTIILKEQIHSRTIIEVVKLRKLKLVFLTEHMLMEK